MGMATSDNEDEIMRERAILDWAKKQMPPMDENISDDARAYRDHAILERVYKAFPEARPRYKGWDR